MVKRFLVRAAARLLVQPVHRQLRGMTLGTRTAVIEGIAGAAQLCAGLVFAGRRR